MFGSDPKFAIRITVTLILFLGTILVYWLKKLIQRKPNTFAYLSFLDASQGLVYTAPQLQLRTIYFTRSGHHSQQFIAFDFGDNGYFHITVIRVAWWNGIDRPIPIAFHG